MISVVVPAYNEEESLNLFYKELKKELIGLKISYEIIFVDDGSDDNTLDALKKIAEKKESVKIYSFRKNRGKAEALTFGFQKAKGDYIVTLDADLQDRPEEIVKLLKKAKDENFEVVCGWRKYRKDSIKKVISSKLFNYFTSVFWKLDIHDYNCGLKLYSKEAAKSLNLYGGMHRFIPILAFDQGFRVTEVPVEHDVRKYGKSKYGFSKIFKDLPDMFTMFFLNKYSKRPFHFFGTVGGSLILIGFIILGYLTYLKILGEAIGERPLLLFGVLSVISGFQIFFTGFIADLVINLSHEKNSDSVLKYSSEEI